MSHTLGVQTRIDVLPKVSNKCTPSSHVDIFLDLTLTVHTTLYLKIVVNAVPSTGKK